MSASGDQSKRSGDGVEYGEFVRGRVVYRLSSERMMEWSDRMELWRPTWKLRTNGHRDGETMP